MTRTMMGLFLLLSSILAIASLDSALAEDESDTSIDNHDYVDDAASESTAELQIIGGQKASPGQFPFFVRSNISFERCGGSLVAPDVVISAGHCASVFSKSKKKNKGVVVGAVSSYNPSAGNAQQRNIVSKMYVHPGFNEHLDETRHDLMVFKIEKVTKSHLKPIDLNVSDNYPVDGQKLRVIGMGVKDLDSGKKSKRLKYVDVDTISSHTCVENYGSFGGGVDPEIMLCARAMNKDSCPGDSGGPIFDLNSPRKLVGITSWGRDCGLEQYPGVYSRVSGDIDWLQNNICAISDHTENLPWCDGKGSNNNNASQCKKHLARCRKGANECCAKNMVCSRTKASENYPRCRQCRQIGQRCGPGKAPCCGSYRCARTTLNNGRIVNKCQR